MTLERAEVKQLPRATETFFRYFANIAKRPSVLNLGEKFNAVTREMTVWALGIDVFKRETFDRETREWHINQYSLKEIIPATREGIRIEGEMALADRVGNETRWRMINDKEKGKAWKIFLRARENPANSDHGWPHERRMERLIEMIVMGVDFLRHDKENIKNWIQLPFIYSSNHDMDQVITEQRNIENKTELKPKAMHGEAAGAMAWLFKPFLGKSGEIEKQQLLREVVGLIIIDMLHDKPELIQKRLTSQVTAASLRSNPENLYQAWEKGEVNVFSFTLADLMTVLRMGKEKAGFVTAETPNGLCPDIEKIYKKQLKSMSEDYSQTFGEMIAFKDENDKKAFLHTLDVCVITDFLDMLVPPRESLVRKFLAPVSRKRPLFRKMPVGEFKNLIISGEGNIPPENDFDLRRFMWEVFHTFDFLRQSSVGKHTFVQRILDTLLVENISFIKQTMPDLMQSNTVEIDAITNERLKRLDIKAKRRMFESGFPPEKLARAERELKEQHEALLKILSEKSVSNESGQYDNRDLELAIKYIESVEKELNIPENYFPLKLPYFGYDSLSSRGPKLIHSLW